MYELTNDDIKLISSKFGFSEAEVRERAYVSKNDESVVMFDFSHPDFKYFASPYKQIGKVIEGKLVLL